MKKITIKGLVRHYWDEREIHRPYRGVLKEVDDKTSISIREEMRQMFDEVPDGSEFEIIIKVKGVDKNTKDYIWKNTKPHVYERVRKSQKGVHIR